jgi:hypothetical protein
MSTFSFGRYAFTLQSSSDESNWISIDSIMIDYSDSNYGASISPIAYDPTMDISIRYDFDPENDEWSYYVGLLDAGDPDNDDDWHTDFPSMNFGIWETNVPDANYVPRTKSFVPEKPRNVSVTHNANGRIVLSWLGNGESFDVSYEIYRKSGGSGFLLFDSLSNDGHPLRGHQYSWMDPEVAGSGVSSIWYLLKARNKSQNSIRVSLPSDTASTTFGYHLQKYTTAFSPDHFQLFQNTPNPFNPSTTIAFEIPEDGLVELGVYNLLGQEVRTLVKEKTVAGLHFSKWDGRDGQGRIVGTGIYFYRLITDRGVLCKKMILLK